MKKNKNKKKNKGLAEFMVKKKISPTIKSANQTLIILSVVLLLFSIWTLKDTSYMNFKGPVDNLEVPGPWLNQ